MGTVLRKDDGMTRFFLNTKILQLLSCNLTKQTKNQPKNWFYLGSIYIIYFYADREKIHIS